MSEKLSQNELLSLTTEIVSDIPQLIKLVYSTLATQGVEEEKEQPEKLMPAVPVKKSVMPEYIICLEDGKKLKMLKRHLKTRYNMTPEEYRQRWGLPHDYPMVAPAYAEQRSTLAKKIGLGRRPAAQLEATLPLAEEPKRRAAGRRKVA
jgi:predicted transcriptional regulator